MVIDGGSGDAMKGGLRQSFRGVGIKWHHTSVQSQDSVSVDEGYCMVSEPYNAGSAYELFARGLVAVGKAMGWVSECVQRVSQNKGEGTIEIDARKGAQVKLFFFTVRTTPPYPTPDAAQAGYGMPDIKAWARIQEAEGEEKETPHTPVIVAAEVAKDDATVPAEHT
ncbi:hypothetical protein EDB85DRAFT_1888296 [Lactarius pseudohatsudake]|nr:hypothetical protein EDB85DRAFT_1888296 [Lactarius pseudohatsudake]